MPLDATNGRNALNDAGWKGFQNLKKSLDNGTYASDYSVGSQVYAKINNVNTLMEVVGINVDSDINNDKIPLTLMTKNILNGNTYKMETSTNATGWPSCYMRNTTMSALYNSIPEYLKNRIVAAKKISSRYRDSSLNMFTSYDKLWIPSCKEINQQGYHKSNEGGFYYSVFASSHSKSYNGTNYTYWTRSMNGQYYYEDSTGTSPTCDTAMRIVIGFCLR